MKKALLFFGDIILLYFSLLLMLLIRFPGNFGERLIIAHLYPFSVVFFVWIIILYIWDLYNIRTKQLFVNYIRAIFMNIIIAMVMFYIASPTKIAPKTNLLLTAGIFSPLFIIWRILFIRILKVNINCLKVGIIGTTNNTNRLLNYIAKDQLKRYEISYIVPYININKSDWSIKEVYLSESTSVYDNLDEINNKGKTKDIAILIVGDAVYRENSSSLYKYIQNGKTVYHIASFFEENYGFIPVYSAGESWLLQNIKEDKKVEFEHVKRIEDVILCLIGFPFFIVLFPIIAFGIKLSGKGPVFFKQIRVGKNGKYFTIYKFRTMVSDAEKNGAQWASINDSRITKVGRFLRISRLDEIPQIINIIKGDMGFVGPRPERPEFIKNLEDKIPHYSMRHLVKPGLTGWAQINAPYASSEEDSAKKLEYDLYYIKNRNLLLDIKIILKTVITVLQRKGR